MSIRQHLMQTLSNNAHLILTLRPIMAQEKMVVVAGDGRADGLMVAMNVADTTALANVLVDAPRDEDGRKAK